MMELDFSLISLVASVIPFVLTCVAGWAALRAPYIPRHVVVMLLFVLLATGIAGIIGSIGRLVDEDVVLDRWIRITLIALRVFAIGGLINVISEFARLRRLPPMRRRADDWRPSGGVASVGGASKPDRESRA